MELTVDNVKKNILEEVEYALKEGKCPSDGCIQKRAKGWVVISNKTGECWGRSKREDGECTYYDSKADAEGALDAYHAAR